MTTATTKFYKGVHSVTVEYDAPAGRTRKTFPTNGAARRFYGSRLTAGLNPKVVSASRVPVSQPSSEESTMSESTSTITATPAPKSPPAAKKAIPKPAAAPAKNGKPAKAKADEGKKSKRLRLFELLSKYPAGLGNAEIRTKLVTDAVAAICRDESVAGRLKVLVPPEGKTGKHFALSAVGRKALEKGTVDSGAAPKAEWPA